MKFLMLFIGWFVLLALCWPLALLALVLLPLVWMICLPFRLAAIVVNAVFAFVKTILLLPARVLGYRNSDS
jgi:hypothetical protein